MMEIRNIEDIKSGYVVRLRNGQLFMCMRYNDEYYFKVFFSKEKSCIADVAKCYNGLKSKSHKNFDIVEVYGLTNISCRCMDVSTDGRKLLYQEEKPKKMTISEIEEKLGYKIEIVSDENID